MSHTLIKCTCKTSTWLLFTSVYFDTTVSLEVHLNKNTLKQTKFEDKTVKSTLLSLVRFGLHDLQIFRDRTAHAWSVEVRSQNFSSESAVKYLHVERRKIQISFSWENKISPMPYPRANKENQIPPPCPPPPPPCAGITLIGALLSGHHRQCSPTFFLPYFLWSGQLCIIALWRFYCKSKQTFGHYTQQSQDVHLWREEWEGSPTGLKNCSLTQESFIIYRVNWHDRSQGPDLCIPAVFLQAHAFASALKR